MSALVDALFLLLKGAGALAALGLAITAVRRWPILGLYAVGVFILLAWEIPAPMTLFAVGGVAIKAEDALFLVLAADTVLNPQRLLANTRKQRPLMFWVALCLVVSLAVGLTIFGSAAINESRTLFWGVGFVAWFLNHDWTRDKLRAQFQKWVTLTGWGLIALFAYHAATYGLGGADSFVSADPSSDLAQTGRPLVAGQAFALACFGLFMFIRSAQRNSFRVFSGLVFLVVAVLCQHRSVWAAVGIAAIIGLSRLRGSARAHSIFWGAYALLILLIPLMAGAFDPLIEDLSQSASSTGTYLERAESWDILVAEAIHQGLWTVVFGTPFGTGYDRVVSGIFVSYSPHNWYVIIFLRLGLFGLVAYAVMVLSILKSLATRKDWIALSVFIGVLVFCWTYALPWYVAPVFAWCAFQAWRPMPEKVTPPPKVKYISPAYARLAQRLELEAKRTART